MYEYLFAPLPSVDAYLERIGLAGARPEATEQWLDTLVQHQLTHIPFDDLDVYSLAACPSLGTDDLFNKIVVRRRGGYCFELNSLFCKLLEAVGFDSYLVIVQIVEGWQEITTPSHCAIVTNIDGKQYFCDVGYGRVVPNGSVLMDGEVHKGYRVSREDYYSLLSTEKGDRVMLFKNLPALPVELLPLNFYISQMPGSPFQRMFSLNLRLDGGSVSIQGRNFRYSCKGEIIERILDSVDEVPELLTKYFGMIPEETPLREFED